jgi:hypothetical protein
MSWQVNLGSLANNTRKPFTTMNESCGPSLIPKQESAARFASAFVPRTRWGLFVPNQIIKARAIPGVARLSFGRDIMDTLKLPDYRRVGFASP